MSDLPANSEKPWGKLPGLRRWLRWEYLVLLLILSGGIVYDLTVLTRSPVAVGIDGYYYVLQVDTFRNSGHFYYPTKTPLVLYFLSFFSLLIGDTVFAIKLSSVVLHALLCVGVYALVTSATRSVWLGVLGIALAASSGLHLYLVAEFINSLGALTLLVWSAWGGIRAWQTRSKGWAIFAATLLAAAFLSHRMTPAVVLVVAVTAVITAWLMGTNRRYKWVALIISLLLWCAPLLISMQPFLDLPTWLRREFINAPQWPFRRLDVAEGLLLLVASLLTLFLITRAKRQTQTGIARHVFANVALWSFLITLNPFLNHHTGFQGIVGRLSSIQYIHAAILLPGLIWLLTPIYRYAYVFVLILCFGLLLLSVTAPLPYGVRPEYLADREHLVRQLPSQRQRLCDSPFVIAPHGEQFVVTSILGVPAQQRPPLASQYKCTYWLLHHVKQSVLTDERVVFIGGEGGLFSVLIEDGELRQLLNNIPVGERRWLLGGNPHLREAVRREFSGSTSSPDVPVPSELDP